MFWDKLNYPIVGLSPMDGVTDAAMRFIAKKYGKADVIYTEFVSAEGLWRLKKRGEMDNKIWKDLIFDESERPVIAQLFGSDPDSFFEATKIVCELGFDGIDINMGCPSPGLEKRGGGAGLMRDQGLAAAVIEATRQGVLDYVSQCHSDTGEKKEIPVSVKTRIGSAKPDESWWKFLAQQKLPAVAMHGRTFKQLYKGEADWESLFKASEIIRESGARFLGNGDVQKVSQCHSDTEEMKLMVELKNGEEVDLTGRMDGVLIGREALGNPWALRKVTQRHSNTVTGERSDMRTLKERLMVMVEHANKYEEIYKFPKNNKELIGWIPGQARNDINRFQFFPMRKHLTGYVRGFEGSVGLRKKLMTAENADTVEEMVNDFLREN